MSNKNADLISSLTLNQYEILVFLANFLPKFAEKLFNSSTVIFFSTMSLFLVAHNTLLYRRKKYLQLLLDYICSLF